MSYYRALGLEAEPFSTSPDPAFFHSSAEHRAALCRLQISIALKRGLSVMVGDIGTGKTTVSRRLSQVLGEDQNVIFRMILNPYFRTEKTVVLLIDEAQILPDFVFEVLRILLNYETNEFKILQLALVGQLELLPRLVAMPNFWDRVSTKVMLKPLAPGDVRDLIQTRLREAGYRGAQPMFNAEAVEEIHAHSEGFPRRVNILCHNVLEFLVMHDKKRADLDIVKQVIARESETDDFKMLLKPSLTAIPQATAEDEKPAREYLRVVSA